MGVHAGLEERCDNVKFHQQTVSPRKTGNSVRLLACKHALCALSARKKPSSLPFADSLIRREVKADMRGLCLQLTAVRTDLDTPKTKTGDLEQDRGINETTNRDRK